jgi:hypothetical protein
MEMLIGIVVTGEGFGPDRISGNTCLGSIHFSPPPSFREQNGKRKASVVEEHICQF